LYIYVEAARCALMLRGVPYPPFAWDSSEMGIGDINMDNEDIEMLNEDIDMLNQDIEHGSSFLRNQN